MLTTINNWNYLGVLDKLRVIGGDSLKPHNGRMFSTKDKDNDIVQIGCAQTYKGAWWYNGCHSSNLNEEYLGGNHSNYANGIIWNTWAGYYYSLKSTRMMIKRHQ
ncbi:Hypothetical predicted protein [Mytilus galloprovincialis]|uniref:Fibrinogen C-terminal domain-containing protein n=1 Tax=Mytilus galloprovincialis TaxID=29158 RepID=A0A8B6DRV1_MYTGA|nr:Hypothetical predicted protein [Mytilus galloprovincialis]